MLLASVASKLGAVAELRAADRAFDAIYRLLAHGLARVVGGGMFALVVLVKFGAGGKGGPACLADELIVCHVAAILS
jgi:hypothetical protein